MQILIDTDKQSFQEVIALVNTVLNNVAITTKEAAKVRGVSPEHVRNQMPRGKYLTAMVLNTRVYSRLEVEGKRNDE